MNSRPDGRCRRGVSLTEIVIAVVFLSIALLPLIGVLIAGHRGTAATLHQTRAFMLADDVVEAVGALPFEEIDAALPGEIAALLPMPPGPDGTPSTSYTRTVSLLPEESEPAAGGRGTLRVRPVEVVVTWEGVGRPETRQVRLVALASRYEP